MNRKRISLPLTDEAIADLKAGDGVLLNGTIYTGRDAAHIRMAESLEKGEELPIDIEGQVIYYVGPTPARAGHAVGSCGPTSAYRMDRFTPMLLERGLKGMIGKGSRSQETVDAIKKHKAIYFAAVGGAAALLSKAVKSSRVIAYEDLGPEAIRKYDVVDFPAVVVVDSYGNNQYAQFAHDED